MSLQSDIVGDGTNKNPSAINNINNNNMPIKSNSCIESTASTGSSVGKKTATILVSKTKTKTGLPLLLKNSINN